MKFKLTLAACSVLICLPFIIAVALANASTSQDVWLPGHSVLYPDGWRLRQKAKSDSIQFLGLRHGNDYLTIYTTPKKDFTLKDMLSSDAHITTQTDAVQGGPLKWTIIEANYSPPTQAPTVYLRAFPRCITTIYITDTPSLKVRIPPNKQVMISLTISMSTQNEVARLTDDQYPGKKYYVGFGDELSGEMGNEVTYDIKHTHDIFTQQLGGWSIIGTTLLGNDVGASDLEQKWQQLKSQMTSDDMYVQYSSGHGSPTGLLFGVSYNEIAQNVLSLPARELIVFIMSCYSGTLTESFDAQKNVWQDFDQKNRTLMVLASSEPSEESETGPAPTPMNPRGLTAAQEVRLVLPSGSHSLAMRMVSVTDSRMASFRWAKSRIMSPGEPNRFLPRPRYPREYLIRRSL